MKHHCPMCGEQWDEDRCQSCGWFEGKPQRYTEPRRKRQPKTAATLECEQCHSTEDVQDYGERTSEPLFLCFGCAWDAIRCADGR